MSETVMNLINAIQAGDATSVEASFHAAMAEKIAPKLDDMRQDVASSMFAKPEVSTETVDTATNE